MSQITDTSFNADTPQNLPENPLTSHPVGTGVGAVAGGLATGAAVGTVAGPIGTAIGAAIGAVVGGLTGKSIAQEIDPSAENTYWRESYSSRPYVSPGASFDQYEPAYGYGVSSYGAHSGRPFDEVESDLERGWDNAKGTSNLAWGNAKGAVRDAWDRLATSPGATPSSATARYNG